MTYRNRFRVERTSNGIVLCDALYGDKGLVSVEYNVVKNNGKRVGTYLDMDAAVQKLYSLGGITEGENVC